MNGYALSKKKIEVIRNKAGEVVFRMAISHLMDVGIRHLTEDTVEDTCKKIMQEDDSKAVMTNNFQCAIVRTAYELAQIPHIDLLVYIQREVAYDVFDGMPSYERAIELLKYALGYLENYNNCNNTENYEAFQDIGLDDEEIELFGFKYLIVESEEE